ncbi:hypothetical protein KI387_008909 [Taxus chinensis]|uniref:PGG domain-containing protein n=1 Tax=Taxus chinensis TaxID=29808 RepID=A0AA38CQ94_TAXCH|nr:hypothetical protein KI387_008909 [Taxus chinensis]
MYCEVFLAAKNGDSRAIQRLHAQNPRHLKEVTFEGNTALHIAAREGHSEVVKWILNNVKGCSMTGARNADSNTPLHEAAKRGNQEVLKILLQYNRCPAAKRNQFGESALLIASEHGHVDAVRVLVEFTPLYIILWPRNDHQTCLHVAAYGGHLEVVRLILDRRSWCNILHLITLIPDIHGATPLHSAVHGGHLEIVNEIVRKTLQTQRSCTNKFYKGLMTKKDKFGRCAVHVAVIKGHFDMVEELITTMPDCVEIRSTDLKTTLHFAVEHNRFEVVRKIILFQNNTEEVAKMVSYDRDISGNTALHLAAINGVDPQLVGFLLSFPNIKVNAINSEGLSAIDVAAKDNPNSVQIISILEDAGASRSFIGHSDPRQSMDSKQENSGDQKIMDVDTLVASLIATVTFTAIFTVPGGIDEKDLKHQGVARRALETLFQVFLFSDSLAMFASLTVVIAWLFRERLQSKLIADRSLLANLSVLSLGTSIISTGLAFLSATILVTIPHNYNNMKNRHDAKEYRLLLGGEIFTAFFVPSLALGFLTVLWVIEYYFKATVEIQVRLKKQLKQVIIYVVPPFVIVLGIIIGYGAV